MQNRDKVLLGHIVTHEYSQAVHGSNRLNFDNASLYALRMQAISVQRAHEEIGQWLDRIWGVSLSDNKSTDKVTVLRTLDTLTREHGPLLDQRLIHYLKNRSYEKARNWLSENSKQEE